jgi:uncharacterized protein YbaP (TraB family)
VTGSRRLAALLWLLLAAIPARGESSVSAGTSHPALWHVQGSAGELYLFGSIHILPANLEWRRGVIADAINRANVFVFEIPLDEGSQARVAALIAERGRLKAGESLHGILSAKAKSDLDADAALAGLSPQALDGLRPWLVELLLVTSRMAHENASPESGADMELQRMTQSEHKEVRYLETLDQQIALIVPSDQKLELSEFEASLKEFRNEKDAFPDLLKAWQSGDLKVLDELVNGEFKDEPEARKALLDDRNRAWVPQLEAMLKEKRVFFVTVGAGHLMGRRSVPELLRADGYRVEGP